MEKRLTTSKESTVKDFLEVIFRRKWIIVGVVLVATLVVVVLNMREPAIYASSGRLLVKRGEAMGVFSPYVRTLTWEEEIASQIEMIKSDVVVNRARQLVDKFMPEGYSTEERINLYRIESGVVSTSNVLWVTYTSGDPVFCKAAVDAIINSYKEYYLDVRTPPEMEDFFSEELSRLQGEIDYWRGRKAELESQWGIIDMEHQQQATLNRLNDYYDDLGEVRADIKEKQDVIEKLVAFRTLDIDEQAAVANTLTQEGAKQTMIERYTEKLLDLRMLESELAGKYTPEHKELKQVRRQIEDLYFYLDKEINSFITVSSARYDLLVSKEQAISELAAQLESEVGAYPGKEVELRRIDTALERVEKQYEEMSNQHMTAKITQASNPEWDITIISPASPAYQRRTKDYVRIALGPMFSLVVALGFAFFVDNLDHSIKNVAEAEETLGCHVLASFPDSEQ